MNGERKKMEERGNGEQAREWKERVGKGGKMKVRETKAWEGKVKIIKEWKRKWRGREGEVGVTEAMKYDRIN